MGPFGTVMSPMMMLPMRSSPLRSTCTPPSPAAPLSRRLRSRDTYSFSSKSYSRPSEPSCLRRLSPDNTVFVLCQLVPPLKLSSGLQSEPLPELPSGPPLASLDLLYEPPSELEGAPCS